MEKQSKFSDLLAIIVVVFLTVSTVIVSFGAGYFFGQRDEKMFTALHRYNYFIKQQQKSNKTEERSRKIEIHIVKPGDSIERIARNNLILKWQLLKANGFKKGVVIHPGQIIKIPQIDWRTKAYEGRASWYGPGFHGKKMANGDVYNQNNILVAHRTFPLGLKVRITNLENGKFIVAKVFDRGPYTKKDGKYDREVDLSYGAALALNSVKKGIVPVLIEPI